MAEPLRQANGIFDLTYAYKDKYILQGAVNYSGSNYIAPGNRYAAFPSVGAAWILSDEKFMENHKFIDFFKVRAQAGQLGAMNFKNSYKYDADWNVSSTNKFGYPENHSADTNWLGSTNTSQHNSSTYTTLENPELDWEKVNEFSAGLELHMLKRDLCLTLHTITEQEPELYSR